MFEIKYEVDGIEIKMNVESEVECTTIEIWHSEDATWHAIVLNDKLKTELIKYLQENPKD